VVKLKPNNAEAWYALGGCYEKAGRKEDADKAFERARTLKPELFKK
jgi:Flp pilus assembly protein TadD